MARCGFKTDIKYYDEKTGNHIPYLCTEPDENNTGLCIFHEYIIGGAVTFGLIIIALRRKFERKFRH